MTNAESTAPPVIHLSLPSCKFLSFLFLFLFLFVFYLFPYIHMIHINDFTPILVAISWITIIAIIYVKRKAFQSKSSSSSSSSSESTSNTDNVNISTLNISSNSSSNSVGDNNNKRNKKKKKTKNNIKDSNHNQNSITRGNRSKSLSLEYETSESLSSIKSSVNNGNINDDGDIELGNFHQINKNQIKDYASESDDNYSTDDESDDECDDTLKSSTSKQQQLNKRILSLALFLLACFVLLFFMSCNIPCLSNHLQRILPASELSESDITIRLPSLHSQYNNLKLAFLTDLHFSSYSIYHQNYKPFWNSIIDSIDHNKPDILLIGGDIVDYETQYVKDGLEMLSKVNNSIGIIKKIAVLGNHDAHKGEQGQRDIVNALEKYGWTFLYNDSVIIKDISELYKSSDNYNHPTVKQLSKEEVDDPKNWLAFVGLADYLSSTPLYSYTPNYLSLLHPSMPRIVLSHNPDSFSSMQGYRADIVLSGHTHGGQIAWPFWDPADQHSMNIGGMTTEKYYTSWPLLRTIKWWWDILPHKLTDNLTFKKYLTAVKNWEYAQGFHVLPRNIQHDNHNYSLDHFPTSSDNHHHNEYNRLYVSKGLAHISTRLFCPPEIAYITLKSDS